ncbi:MAG: type II toxin-antitoxin system HicB family antitoxin [Geobacteraceae bacterium]|nr:type II toxin-antitoxin system HicB family antitoxin [Geobacteraceae bacterium]
MKVKKVKAIEPPYRFEEYMHEIAPLAKEDGGGFLITFPDLPGCMSDGETIEEAIANGRDAFAAWISAAADMGRPIPKPAAKPVELIEASGKFVARLPKTLHARLVARAKQEGVSLNTLVLTFIAEGLGHKETCAH